MLIFRNLCPNSFFKTSTQQTNRHPKDEHFVGKAANPKKTSPKIGPLKAPFIVSNWWPNFFTDKESILKSFAGFFFTTSFQPFWRGIARLHVFLWPFWENGASLLCKHPPLKPSPKKKIRWKLHVPCAARLLWETAMAPRLAFKVKHVLSQKWHCTLSSTYKHSTELGCKKRKSTPFFLRVIQLLVTYFGRIKSCKFVETLGDFSWYFLVWVGNLGKL